MYNIFKLKNGLRVVVEDIDYVNSVSVGLWVENGSRNENEKNNGISHFIEHMLFKGTIKRTSKELAESIEDIGGQLNAFTSKEATCYYVKILDSYLELAVEVLSDMLFNSKFAVEDIEKEKGVVIEEINMSEDSPEDVLIDLQCKATWGEDSLSLPILGTTDTVKSFTQKDIKEYVESHYIPENSVISISGKFDMNSIEKLINKYFGHWESNNKKVTTYSNPEIINNVFYKKKSIEQLHLSLSFEGIKLGDDNIYSLLIINNILGGGASSILFQKIREEMGICYSIYSYISTYKNVGLINIYAGLNPNYAAEAIKVIKAEVEAYIKRGITEEKLSKAKEQVKGSYILGLESTSSRMFSNGKSVLFLNRVNEPKMVLEKINAVKMENIIEIMAKTFGKGILNATFVGDNVDFEVLTKLSQTDIIAYKNPTKLNI
ncbi:MAG: insulinase family protein [Clostridiaceae bacterium]|nr:insulinase family protein [Clostridiaceae bacterium]